MRQLLGTSLVVLSVPILIFSSMTGLAIESYLAADRRAQFDPRRPSDPRGGGGSDTQRRTWLQALRTLTTRLLSPPISARMSFITSGSVVPAPIVLS